MPPRMTPRRYPPPWTIEEHEECFIVRDAAGGLAYIGCWDKGLPFQRQSVNQGETP